MRSFIYSILMFAFTVAFYVGIDTLYANISFISARQNVQRVRAEMLEDAVRDLSVRVSRLEQGGRR